MREREAGEIAADPACRLTEQQASHRGRIRGQCGPSKRQPALRLVFTDGGPFGRHEERRDLVRGDGMARRAEDRVDRAGVDRLEFR